MARIASLNLVRPMVLVAALGLFSGCGLAGFPDFRGGDAAGGDPNGDAGISSTPADDASERTLEDDELGVAVRSLAHSNVIDRGDVKTTDPNDNGRLDKGEKTACDPEFDGRKSACSEDVDLVYRVCMIEEDQLDASLQISRDLLDREMCGDFQTVLECTGTELVQGETQCVGGPYCDAIIDGIWEPMVCGWKITEFAAYSAATGELLEVFTEEAIDEMGFELLEVPATVN